jgi:hypothetical protein
MEIEEEKQNINLIPEILINFSSVPTELLLRQ